MTILRAREVTNSNEYMKSKYMQRWKETQLVLNENNTAELVTSDVIRGKGGIYATYSGTWTKLEGTGKFSIQFVRKEIRDDPNFRPKVYIIDNNIIVTRREEIVKLQGFANKEVAFINLKVK